MQSINQSSPDFTAQESSAGMLLSCRCTSQITPEGNYQAINPDIRRVVAAYITVKKKNCNLFLLWGVWLCRADSPTDRDRSRDVGSQTASQPDLKAVIRRSCRICLVCPDRPVRWMIGDITEHLLIITWLILTPLIISMVAPSAGFYTHRDDRLYVHDQAIRRSLVLCLSSARMALGSFQRFHLRSSRVSRKQTADPPPPTHRHDTGTTDTAWLAATCSLLLIKTYKYGVWHFTWFVIGYFFPPSNSKSAKVDKVRARMWWRCCSVCSAGTFQLIWHPSESERQCQQLNKSRFGFGGDVVGDSKVCQSLWESGFALSCAELVSGRDRPGRKWHHRRRMYEEEKKNPVDILGLCLSFDIPWRTENDEAFIEILFVLFKFIHLYIYFFLYFCNSIC